MAPLLDAAGIVASDMARSLGFYRLLGLDVPDTPEEGHVNILLPNGLRLMLDSEEEIRKFRPDWTRQLGNQFSLAFQCDSPTEVDTIYSRMISAGYQGDKEPWDAFWGQRYAQLRDPDGVPVDLYAALLRPRLPRGTAREPVLRAVHREIRVVASRRAPRGA